MEDVNITNNYSVANSNTYAAALVSYNYGTIENCGVESGTIKGNKTVKATASTGYIGAKVGGIAGHNEGTIRNCYVHEKVSISAYSPTTGGTVNQASAGGIVGYNANIVQNCYNMGSVYASSYLPAVGGLMGQAAMPGSTTTKITNCYNTGSVNAAGAITFVGGIVGVDGWTNNNPIAASNFYCLPNTRLVGSYWNGSGYDEHTSQFRDAAVLRTYAATLGTAFKEDKYYINDRIPNAYMGKSKSRNE